MKGEGKGREGGGDGMGDGAYRCLCGGEPDSASLRTVGWGEILVHYFKYQKW